MSLGPRDICFSCSMRECEKCTGYTLMGHLCQCGCKATYLGMCLKKHWDWTKIPDGAPWSPEMLALHIQQRTLPPCNVEVFAWAKNGGLIYTARIRDVRGIGEMAPEAYNWDFALANLNLTHWTPRPEPPKE